MKTKSAALCLLTFVLCLSAFAQGTAFTYQGRLNVGANPANGTYDLQFTPYGLASGGSGVAAPLTKSPVGVTNGLFTVTLDFGAGVFTGASRWLEIGVRTNGGASFTVLSPRQPLTPTPYALYAPSAGTATTAQAVTANAVTGAGIASGQVVKSLNGLRDAVALAAGPNVSFATNANTLTISAAGGGASGGWATTGNAGTTPAANFLGTTDGQPLVINAGSVGINTNDPQATLHVNGTVLATQFAGDGSGLTNVPATLAAPFTLTNLATTNFYGPARGLAISGRYAYVAQGYASLQIYDISDPAHPTHVGPQTELTGNASAVALSGHYAFVAGDRLFCVDVSSPANPVIVGSSTWDFPCYGVALAGNVACVAADAEGLFIEDISNPTTPVNRSHIDNGGNALGVAVSGNFAYLANGLDGLRIYNIANFAAPVNVGHRNDGGRALAIAVAGDFAYLANEEDGLRIYNVSDPANPVNVGHITDTVYSYGVTVSGRYLYMANNNEGLWVYDVSDPANPIRLAVAPVPDAGVVLAVVVAGHYAFSANESGGLATYFVGPLATVPGVISATGFMGDGSNLTNLNAGQLNGQLAPSVAAGLWQVTGNAGTTPGQDFLGTTDNQPLEFKVNGERALRLEPSGISPNVIGGYAGNVVSEGITGATIGGGGSGFGPFFQQPNRVEGNYATVVGGRDNTASGEGSTAMGDWTKASGAYSTAMGGSTRAGGDYSTAMGLGNSASGYGSTAMGRSTTASGYGSTAMGFRTTASGTNSFAAGSNTLASGWASFAMGINAQATNTAAVALGQDTIAGGAYSTAMGHSTKASGDYSTALGAFTEAATAYTMAAGRRAKAMHEGAFVWADSQEADFSSAASNQFLIRAGGGVGINKNAPVSALDVNGTVAAGNFTLSGPPYGDVKLRDDAFHGLGWYGAGKLFAGLDVNGPALYGNAGGVLGARGGGVTTIALRWDESGKVGIGTTSPNFTLEVNGSAGKPGGGAWSVSSDVRLKKNIQPLSGVLEKLLALRGVSFEYKDPESSHERSGERIGMIAQEVERVFPDWVETGPDGFKRLTYRGFESLTVEALRELRAEKDAEIQMLRAKADEVDALRQRLERLEQLLNAENGGGK
jgi:hypothetical protein